MLGKEQLSAVLETIAAFHGHRCPGIAYGLRIAIAGMAAMSATRESDIVIYAYASSCALDAIQIETGCTLGNGKLIVHDRGEHEFCFWRESANRGTLLKPIKTVYTDSTLEAEMVSRFSAGDRSKEVRDVLDRRLQKKISHVLSAGEVDIIQIKPVTTPPFINRLAR